MKPSDQPNAQYTMSQEAVKRMRDCLGGEPVIKSPANQLKYLPHPYPQKAHSEEGANQYKRYLANADYDNIPVNTLESLLGALFRRDPDVELPGMVDYLLDDFDGDGLTLNEALKLAASEMLTQRYMFALAEFSNLESVNIDEMTVADARASDLKSMVKFYRRECVKDWAYRKVNGKKQLVYVALEESEDVIKNGKRESVTATLVLALDEDGYYYQQKFVGENESDRIYPQAAGQNIRFITGEFLIAGDHPKGEIPTQLGYIYPIASKALSRYRLSADYKETLWLNGAPITTSSGWDKQALELYKQATGLDTVSSGPGAHIPLPAGGTFGIHGGSSESAGAYERALDTNAAEIRALGGVFDTTEGTDESTATGAAIKAAEKSGVLSSLAADLDASFTKLIEYCCLFMKSPTDGISIKVNREFSKHTLTAQDRAAIIAEWMDGAISRSEMMRQLKAGGVLRGEIDEIVQELESEA